MNIIGIDVSKSKLDCALIDNSTHRKLKFKVVSNSEEGFVTLIDWLAKCAKSSISAYHFIKVYAYCTRWPNFSVGIAVCCLSWFSSYTK